MKYPYSDKYMTYDYQTHRYVLTDKDVIDNMGINFIECNDNDKAREMMLRQVSLQVYSFIHKHSI